MGPAGLIATFSVAAASNMKGIPLVYPEVTGWSLTEMQAHLRGRRSQERGTWPLTVVVCLLLMALLATVQVAHVHPVDSNPVNCPLCVAMHSAAPVAVTATAVILVELGFTEPVAKARASARQPHPAFFIRPPPAGLKGAFPA